MRTLSWGILSTANIGIKRVIPALLSSTTGRIAAIASRNAERAAQVAHQFGIEKSYASYDALIGDPDIEAIYNPLPNHLHVEWTVKALAAGKHVLCEKPIGLNAREAEAIVAARDRSGKRVIEAFMVRHHPQWQRVRTLIDSGRIGRLGAVQSAFLFTMLDPKNVRNQADIGGGALYDVGCYPIVTARYLFKSEPDKVIALIDRDPTLRVDRVTSALAAFPGGGQLAFTSALQLSSYQKVVALGTGGRIEIEVPFTPMKDHACRIRIEAGEVSEVEEFAPVDQYRLQCDTAVRVFRGEIEQEFPIEDAIANMRVIDALYRSAESGRWEVP